MKFKTPDPIEGRMLTFKVTDVAERETFSTGTLELAHVIITSPAIPLFGRVDVVPILLTRDNTLTLQALRLMASAKAKDLSDTKDFVGLEFPGYLKRHVSDHAGLRYSVEPMFDGGWLAKYLGEYADKSAERCPNCDCVLEEKNDPAPF